MGEEQFSMYKHVRLG